MTKVWGPVLRYHGAPWGYCAEHIGLWQQRASTVCQDTLRQTWLPCHGKQLTSQPQCPLYVHQM